MMRLQCRIVLALLGVFYRRAVGFLLNRGAGQTRRVSDEIGELRLCV